MATDLGDALTAYWRSEQWWGGPQFITWLINNGHMSEAAYAVREVMKIERMPPRQRRIVLGQAKRLQALERRPPQQPSLPHSDAGAGGPSPQPSSASTTSGTAAEPSDDLRP
uniref:hypothetical protein n=1 Tax=Streptosporangium sp. CA-256172 TaxID=3240076 RepID=UPI003F494162